MSATIIVEFSQHDDELKAALQEALGNDMEFLEVRSFDSGTLGIIQAIVPAVPALVKVLVAYFTRPNSPSPLKRVVVTKDGGLSLEGYSSQEVEQIVAKLSTGSTAIS